MASYFWLDGSNNRYYLGQSFTYNNVQYTSSGASSSTFTTLGFTQITVAAKPDTRFFNVSGPANNGSWTSTDKPLALLKDTYVEHCRGAWNRAVSGAGTLSELIYAFKDSGSLPATYTTFLTNAKTYYDANVVKVNAVTNATGMEALVTADKWVLVDPSDLNDGYQLNSSTYLEPMPLNPDALEEIYGTITLVRAGANLTSAKFGATTAGAAAAGSVSGVFGYELKLKATHGSGTVMDYSMPNGFSGTGVFPATGTTTIQVLYQSATGTQIGTDITVAAGTGTQTLTFGNEY